jgi:hypothetical protein
LSKLDNSGAQLKVALIAASRGTALRLAEKAGGFQVVVVGKNVESGDGNDGPTPPVFVGKTLVVQGPNHLQALGVLDLYLRDGSLDLADASGATLGEQRQSLERRIDELSKRLVQWRASGALTGKDLEAREAELSRMRLELKQLTSPGVPASGSYFRYQVEEVHESAGVDAAVGAEMLAFYKQVNDHNRVAFADRLPPKPEAGAAHYVGVERCATCHRTEHAFWQGTRHAQAYEVLSTQHKEFNLDCVGCHVTGYEKPGGSTVTHVDGLKSVQCENCHGPGSIHSETALRKDIVGTPSQELCKGCHHPPHVADDWDVKLAWPKILGPGHQR